MTQARFNGFAGTRGLRHRARGARLGAWSIEQGAPWQIAELEMDRAH